MCFEDDRGFFLETFHEKRYKEMGLKEKFVQQNHSRSKKGVLRGLHYQINKSQAQIVTIMSGTVYYVAVDLRSWSETFGGWFGVELGDQGIRQFYMEPGFAGGFCVLKGDANLHYFLIISSVVKLCFDLLPIISFIRIGDIPVPGLFVPTL